MSLVRIIGLDPGLRHTGWGVIDVCGQELRFVNAGVIDPVINKQNLSVRLADLHCQLGRVIGHFSPHEASVEEVFVNANPASTLKLGMARGVVLLAPAQINIPVYEYSANQVKKTVVGGGHASKEQVTFMVRRFLPRVPADIRVDAADALAIAICHALYRNFTALSNQSAVSQR